MYVQWRQEHPILRSQATTNKKKKGGQEDDFYRFQIRQRKQNGTVTRNSGWKNRGGCFPLEFATLKRQKETNARIVEDMSRAKKFKLA